MENQLTIKGSNEGFLTCGTYSLIHWQWVYIGSSYYWTFTSLEGDHLGKYDHTDETTPVPERAWFAHGMLAWILSLADSDE